jgi:hypothetical protein
MDHSLEEIVNVEGQLQRAMVGNDVAGLERLLHDGLVFTDFTGSVVGKRDDIAARASGTVHLKSRRLNRSMCGAILKGHL